VRLFYHLSVPDIVSMPLALFASYLVGSISFGILVAKARGVDIRATGSNNPGASNVLRVLGKRDAALVLLGDGLKGAAAAWLGVAIGGPEFGYVTLLVAVIGHTFPIWHQFDGGKSVATALGGILYLSPIVGVFLMTIWLVAVVVGKRASLGSIIAMVLLVPALWIAGRPIVGLIVAALIAGFVVVRHSGNIKRLMDSTERKIAE